ncbi:MAG: right-handed parallel beta-helix repeat-containing protein [Pirellula sp.]
MDFLSHSFHSRRRFCAFAASGLLVGRAVYSRSLADEPPRVTNPRATDGDSRLEPNWTEKLTVTVSNTKGDFVGSDHRVIQGALDYVTRLGGGTVHVLPGTYTFRNAVFLPSKVRLLGSGPDAILTKIPSEAIQLSEDSDWYDQEITLSSSGGFQVGDGVVFQATNPDDKGQTVIKRTLIARNGNRFKLDKGLRENLWISGKPKCSSLFPILTSEFTSDVVIENITIDGNKANNENFNGNYGGCVFLQDCQRYQIRNCTTRNYNGDGISFQICHDVLVQDCHSHDNNDLGIHPGSGSQRPLIRRNRMVNNSQGLFWCWGVKYGLAEDNVMDGNRLYGVSIGHNDTDNVMVRNKISNSGKIGILFRNENRGKDFFPNRNTLIENEIINSGGEDGIAIDVQGQAKDLEIRGNKVTETRAKANRIGLRIGPQVGKVDSQQNQFAGLARDVVDERT